MISQLYFKLSYSVTVFLCTGNLGVDVESYARQSIRLAAQIDKHLPAEDDDSDGESDILLSQDQAYINKPASSLNVD